MRARQQRVVELERWLFALVLVVASGCSTSTTDEGNVQQRRPGSEAPPGVDLEMDPLPTGVARDIEVASASGLSAGEVDVAPDGLRVELDRCELVAPGQWVFHAVADLPADVDEATVELVADWSRDDQSWSASVALDLVGSGELAFGVDRVALERQRVAEEGEDWTVAAVELVDEIDRFDHCALEIADSNLAVDDADAGTVPVTSAAEPVEYDAPSDSIWALGIGARLDDPDDGRRLFAYLAWLAVPLPFDEIVVPVDPSRPWAERLTVGLPERGGRSCPSVSFTLPHVIVSQTDECSGGVPPDSSGWESLGPVDGHEGFELLESSDGVRAIRRSIGEWDVFVIGSATTQEMVVVAQGLTTAAHPAPLDVEAPIDVGSDLDSTVARVLEEDGYVERDRLEEADGTVQIVAAPVDADPQSNHGLAFYLASQDPSGWQVRGEPPESTDLPQCASYSVSTGPNRPPRVTGVAARADWQLEFKQGLTDEWVRVPTVHGVYAAVHTADAPATFAAGVRAIDADGRVIDDTLAEEYGCFR